MIDGNLALAIASNSNFYLLSIDMVYELKKILLEWRLIVHFILFLAGVVLLTEAIYQFTSNTQDAPCILCLDSTIYANFSQHSLIVELIERIHTQPFNLVSSLIFVCAILHTFAANRFKQHAERRKESGLFETPHDMFVTEIISFLGEVEVIFGLWIIPLYISMTWWFDEAITVDFMEHRDFSEALFILVIMCIASSRPILHFAERAFQAIARLFGNSTRAWWLTILTVGPLLGSFLTEPGAMTLSALLLSHHIYQRKPSSLLAYATLGLLFVNVSVGGVLTHFAAPPVLMVSTKWEWNTPFMFTHFGYKAIIAICISNALYAAYFWKELGALDKVNTEQKNEEEKIPSWIVGTHILLLTFIVLHSHSPVIFLGLFLLYIGFHQATAPFQNALALKEPLLVAFFLASLIVHTSLQGWWIEPTLVRMGESSLMTVATFLTSFNDNAAITSLGALIPDLAPELKYALVAGAVTGGGLTVIANAPNPAGQALLQCHFEKGISPLKLFAAALIPTIVTAIAFLIGS